MPANIDPRRSSSQGESAAKLSPAFIERMRVVNVNIRDFTCDTTSEFTFKNKFDIPFQSPYCNQTQGEGFNVMPEVGAICWVCSPSEEGRESFIMGWTMVDEDGSYRGGRELLNPGDMHLSTRDKNFIYLRRGGVVQIGATPVCQRVYLPIRNIIQDYAENYELHTPAGDLTWKVLRKEEDGEGHQACIYTLACKEFADDPNDDPIGVLKIGSHGEGNDTILSLLTRDKGGGATVTCLEINKNGELTWEVQKLTVKVKGDMDLLIDGLFKVFVGGTLDIEAVGAFSLAASSIAMSAASGASIAMDGFSMSLDAAAINISEALYPVVRASPDLIAWMGAVTAQLAGAPGPPAPVLTALPIAALAPILHTNAKVKV